MTPTRPPVLTQAHRRPEERKLHLAWSDGHQADYDYDYLRGYCPCAGCQGHGAGPVVFQAPARPVTLEAIEPVGRYAVSFLWSDQHGTGIYSFDFLRRLCPCPDCASGTAAPEPVAR